ALVGVLVAYEPGEDASGADEASASPPAPTEPEHPGPGCEGTGRTDPADLAVARVVARCAPGAPEPRPLDDEQRLRIAVEDGAAAARPLLVADRQGELAAEGLDVEIVSLPAAEGYAALAEGKVDAVVGRLHAALFDAVHAG